jgi:hypothetical protein
MSLLLKTLSCYENVGCLSSEQMIIPNSYLHEVALLADSRDILDVAFTNCTDSDSRVRVHLCFTQRVP